MARTVDPEPQLLSYYLIFSILYMISSEATMRATAARIPTIMPAIAPPLNPLSLDVGGGGGKYCSLSDASFDVRTVT
jgi:hypothetical protein